jgi:8-oxo-dGTP diphosphatase
LGFFRSFSPIYRALLSSPDILCPGGLGPKGTPCCLNKFLTFISLLPTQAEACTPRLLAKSLSERSLAWAASRFADTCTALQVQVFADLMEPAMGESAESYDASQYERPSVTADVVIFSILNGQLKVLLIQRKNWPYEGMWAIPGGFVDMHESLEEAAYRELQEETGVGSDDVYLEQLYTFGDPERDPRTRVITVAHFALVCADKLHVRAASDAADIGWFDATDPPPLAFDHAQILEYALTRLRYKLEYTAVGFQLLPDQFTLRELQAAYETVLGEKLDKDNFRSKIRKSKVVEPTDGYKQTGGRPARLYRFRDDAVADAKTRRLFP